MNEFNNGFSEVSMEELDQIEGGAAVAAAGAVAFCVGLVLGFTAEKMVTLGPVVKEFP